MYLNMVDILLSTELPESSGRSHFWISEMRKVIWKFINIIYIWHKKYFVQHLTGLQSLDFIQQLEQQSGSGRVDIDVGDPEWALQVFRKQFEETRGTVAGLWLDEHNGRVGCVAVLSADVKRQTRNERHIFIHIFSQM